MADWKQITARIRRARTGKDPAGQLSSLYEKTRDAMVAFELARHFETEGQSAEAAKWYSTAAERFRRSEWKNKAQEAAARLGVPASDAGAPPESASSEPALSPMAVPEPAQPFVQTATTFESLSTPAESTPSAASAPPASRRPHRGRRGGRNRRKGSAAKEPLATQRLNAQMATLVPPSSVVDAIAEPRFGKVSESISGAGVAAQAVTDSGAAAVRGRYGDPGVSSRLSVLEMQFRRLLTCTPLKLENADRAPAGPGVLLLSDSDLATNYYVEACQTLRVAITHLSRGTSTRRGANPIKPRLAEHLGIAESRVSKYLAEHCVIRYLQLDDDASYFAHFVVAVLRPALNE
jgi:hypothetical protein